MPSDNWILLVDDNDDDILLLRRTLNRERVPANIVTASDGVAALDLLLPEGGSGGRLPKLVLLDINMPRLSGHEVLERLRREAVTRLLPVVMLSTSDDDRDVSRAYGAGANSFVQKPLDLRTFQSTVRAIGEYWLGLNETPPLDQPQPA